MNSVWLLLRRGIILAAIAGLSFVLWRQLTEVPDAGTAMDQRIAGTPTWLPGSPSPKTNASGSNEISARDLFVSAAPPTSAAPPPLAAVAPAFALIGTGIGPPSFALIHSNANAPGLRVTKGMKVDGWDVIDVRKNNLVLSQGSATWIIGFAPEVARQCSSAEC